MHIGIGRSDVEIIFIDYPMRGAFVTRGDMKQPVLSTVVVLSLLGSGCMSVHQGRQNHQRSSVTEFLYPNREARTEQPRIPHMELPLNVGIAFVPEKKQKYSRGSGPSEKRKEEFLKKVAEQFKDRPFIKNIEIIPTTYLKPGGGFDNLEQLRTMFDVEVIALVAYDQIQHTDEDWLTMSYLTVVGAFLIQGEKNDTSTMMDTAVFHIPSRKLLFRAPGTSHVKARSTLVNHSERLRLDSDKGMAGANTKMIANLDRELGEFKTRVKEKPDKYKITHARGYIGGGNFGALGGIAIAALMLIGGHRARRS